jgi:hypothetical protein
MLHGESGNKIEEIEEESGDSDQEEPDEAV